MSNSRRRVRHQPTEPDSDSNLIQGLADAFPEMDNNFTEVNDPTQSEGAISMDVDAVPSALRTVSDRGIQWEGAPEINFNPFISRRSRGSTITIPSPNSHEYVIDSDPYRANTYHLINWDKVHTLEDIILILQAIDVRVSERNPAFKELKERGYLI